MILALEAYISDYIEGRRTSPFVRGILYLISKGFACGVHMRNWMFDHGCIKQIKAPLPVVSVGNIIAGGTGKTALVQKMGRDLGHRKKVCVLLRGYRSAMEKEGGGLLSPDSSSIAVSMCGDEARFLREQLPELILFVGKNRCLHAQRAAEYAADLIVLDDGMQYRRLYRDFELVMLHAEDLYGKGHFLPRGTLRDAPKRLARADYIFINHVKDHAHFDWLRKKVKQQIQAPLIGVRMVPKGIRDREGNIWDPSLGVQAGVFCGLGKPQSFFKTVQEAGIEVIEQLALPDHTTLGESQLMRWACAARDKGCQLLVCSEKDWVKLPLLDSLPLPIARLQAMMEVVCNGVAYQELLSKVLHLTNGCDA